MRLWICDAWRGKAKADEGLDLTGWQGRQGVTERGVPEGTLSRARRSQRRQADKAEAELEGLVAQLARAHD